MSAPLIEKYIASFDIGSSAVKAVLVTREGQMQLAHTVSYPSAPAHSEQDPRDWWLAFCDVLKNWWAQGVAPNAIAALTFSGQMQSLIALDAQGRVLCPAWLHTDARAAEQAARITEQFGCEEIHRVTRNPFNATSVLPKLLHLREHEPALWARTERVLVGAKDFIGQRLTGRAVTDPTTSATTGMFDLEQGVWAHEWLAALGLKPVLPELLNADAQMGVVTAQAAALTGLMPGCPVLCGLGDAAATTLGAGVSDPSQCYAYLGTSGWVARVSRHTRDQFNPPGAPLFVLPYLPPQSDRVARRILIGPISNAGAVHRWAVGWLDGSGHLSDAQRYAQFEQAVADAPFDARLMFLPYLSGERLPVNSSAGQGAIVGLSTDTTRAQVMRAALEGVSLSLRWALDLLQADGVQASSASRELIVVGGATRSAQWMQILANCFNAPLHIASEADLLPCLGAAATAAVTVGWCASPEAFVRQRQVLAPSAAAQTVHPHAEAAAQMQAKSARWRALQAAVSTLSGGPN
jgi:xylulokinase